MPRIHGAIVPGRCNPSFAPVWVNPSFIAERGLAAGISRLLLLARLERGQRWVDIGCGTRPYEPLFPAGTYTGLDVLSSGRPDTLKRPDVLYGGGALPFASSILDGILCTQVLEHVPHPDELLAECWRALKPGGKLILSAPFVWQEHEQPYDFFRFTSYGMDALLRQQGFACIDAVKSSGSLETLAQLASTYLATSIKLPIPGVGRLLTLFACCPLQLSGLILQGLLPDRRELFLDMLVLACKPS